MSDDGGYDRGEDALSQRGPRGRESRCEGEVWMLRIEALEFWRLIWREQESRSDSSSSSGGGKSR